MRKGRVNGKASVYAEVRSPAQVSAEEASVPLVQGANTASRARSTPRPVHIALLLR